MSGEPILGPMGILQQPPYVAQPMFWELDKLRRPPYSPKSAAYLPGTDAPPVEYKYSFARSSIPLFLFFLHRNPTPSMNG
jgi:hypothetical protein